MAPRSEPPTGPFLEPVRPPPAPRLLSYLSYASKRSFRSHSSSFEADDERSSITSVEEFGMMSGSNRSRRSSDSGSLFGNGHLPPPRYPGEDTRPTSNKELAGWYAYAFAAEVYVICGQ